MAMPTTESNSFKAFFKEACIHRQTGLLHFLQRG